MHREADAAMYEVAECKMMRVQGEPKSDEGGRGIVIQDSERREHRALGAAQSQKGRNEEGKYVLLGEDYYIKMLLYSTLTA